MRLRSNGDGETADDRETYALGAKVLDDPCSELLEAGYLGQGTTFRSRSVGGGPSIHAASRATISSSLSFGKRFRRFSRMSAIPKSAI